MDNETSAVDEARFSGLVPLLAKAETALVWREQKQHGGKVICAATVRVGPFYCDVRNTGSSALWSVTVHSQQPSTGSEVVLAHGLAKNVTVGRSEAERFLKILLQWVIDDLVTKGAENEVL